MPELHDARESEVDAALVRWIEARRRALGRLFVLGIAGAQGTGKSTLAARLVRLLAERSGVRGAVLGLDDLYLTRAERERLARDLHPLLRTRGVPGTHDVALGARTIAALRAAAPGERVALPRFDKASDDRAARAQWPEVEGPLDVLIFEGWCVGALPQDEAALAEPVNDFEREHDPDGGLRRYVNAQLAGPYAALFRELDALLFLAAPDLQSSLSWRIQQERELAARSASGRALMSDAEVARFVQHFERISRHMLQQAPARADAVLQLDPDHRVAMARIPDC